MNTIQKNNNHKDYNKAHCDRVRAHGECSNCIIRYRAPLQLIFLLDPPIEHQDLDLLFSIFIY